MPMLAEVPPTMSEPISFQCDPACYRHWRVEYQGEIARLRMDVDEDATLTEGYKLKLNSYDLGVDIELADIVTRLRFEHPEVRVVILESAKERVFCAGANIRMLAAASHAHKVNFCKFTNETRNCIETAGEESGQYYLCAIRGACVGGGYELALACDYLMLADDGSSAVALPEMPLLAVLPGTGGLTRLTDKRKVRRDRADVFCSLEEGIKGKKAKEWGLVDEVVPNARFGEIVTARARELASRSDRPAEAQGIVLEPLAREVREDGSIEYSALRIQLDRQAGTATLAIRGPEEDPPAAPGDLRSGSWILRLARELDDAVLHLRFNELELGIWLFTTQGDPGKVLAHEALLLENCDHWLAREVLNYWKRVLKRLDVTSRSLVALVERGSCFAGLLAELVFAADRSYMMLGEFENDPRPPATVTVSEANFGPLRMANGLTRLENRFWGEPERIPALEAWKGKPMEAGEAESRGLVTFAFDEVDWEEEVRIFLEERASFSPDALTGMEANLRFAGPETMETRIFGRLSAWQNWIFSRPNAVGEQGALRRYGTGVRGSYQRQRV